MFEHIDEVAVPEKEIREASYKEGYELGIKYSRDLGKELGFYEYITKQLPEKKATIKLLKLVNEFPVINNVELDYNLMMARIRAQYKLVKTIHNMPAYPSESLSF